METMNKVTIRPVEKKDKDLVLKILNEHWGSALIISRGLIYYADELPGFIAEIDNETAGLITYYLSGNKCEIISLNSYKENIGIGTGLLRALIEEIGKTDINKISVITTNDNLQALGFYQKRNFHMFKIYPGAVKKSRKIKPSIPLYGSDGIEIRDEIELIREI